MELVARAYDAAAWRFRCPWRDMNFPDVESLEEAEFLAPPPLLTNADRARHRQEQRRLAIAEHDEGLIQQWCEEYPCDVQEEEAIYAAKRKERRAEYNTPVFDNHSSIKYAFGLSKFISYLVH
jgi:hypothetical protein